MSHFQSFTPHRQSQTFTLFPQLPAELQLKIWSHAAETPRLVLVGKPSINVTRIPAVLHVCSDSRKAGLRVYSLLFSDSNENPQAHPKQRWSPRSPNHPNPKPVYFNKSLDILQFDSWPRHKCYHHGLCDAEDLASVESLAVSKSLWTTTNKWIIWRDLPLFKSLKEIFLVNDGDGTAIEAAHFTELVQWSFDGTAISLYAGTLRAAFTTEIEKMVSTRRRRRWRPKVVVAKFTVPGDHREERLGGGGSYRVSRSLVLRYGDTRA